MIGFVRILAILLIGMTVSVGAAAQDDLDALRRRLSDIEAEQAKSQATIEALRSQLESLGKETEEIRNVVTAAPAIADPAKTTMLLGPPSVSGPPTPNRRAVFPELANETQFALETQAGDFRLGFDGLLVGRYELNHRRKNDSGSSDTESGFEIIGTRLNFKGHVFDDFNYWVRLQADEFGSAPFFDAVLGYYRFNEDTTLVLGQFPSVLTRAQGIPADKIQVGESSPTNYAFDPFGFKGLMLGYHTPRLIFRGIINDGYRSISNSFFEEEVSSDWAFAGQVVGMAVGDEEDWARFDNFTSRPGSDFAWQINGAFLAQGSPDLYLGILESSMEGDGWNLYGAAYYRYTDLASDSIDGNYANDFGFEVLAGAWVAKKVELFSRFDMTIPDSDRLMQDDVFRTVTVGANFYPIARTDNIKFIVEGLYMFDSEADSIVEPNTFSSVRESPAGDQFVFRTQAHIRF